jgi:predicted nuclease of predicted toxin-antitoxin system
VKLLLDEMLSPAIARQLRDAGHDVQAIKKDRPDLESTSDAEIVRRLASEQRAIVTNDIADFTPIHNQMLARGEEHYGMVFSSDATLPRNKANIPLWIETLDEFLTAHQPEDALRNQLHHLS